MSPQERTVREALRRFVRDESGMTMGLAIGTVVLIGVMGAGLLTFVATDLNTVVEANQGQRAFEMADAGIRAAELQLISDSTLDHYDGGANDVQWSLGRNGVTLNDLDESAATTDSTTVTIGYVPSAGHFRVVSDGRYGDARRKIEAVFEAGGGSNGIRAYYTPGDVNIQNSNKNDAIRGVSFFSGRNILLKDFDFADYGGNSASVKIQTGVTDALGDWNTTDDSPTSYWNTVGRVRGPANVPFTDVGFAAEGYICRSADCPNPDPDPNVVATSTDEMISDGIYGYDRRTGTRGNELKFSRKYDSSGREDPTKNPNGTDGDIPARDVISYPFSRERPNVEALLERARSGGVNAYVNAATTPYDFDTIYDSDAPRVVFVDANGEDVRLSIDNGSRRPQGIIVVRCGNLTIQEEEFTGIVMVLDDDDNVNRRCRAGDGKSKYKAERADVRGYVYVESTNKDDALYVDSDSTVSPLPAGQEYEELFDLAWSSGSIRLQSWRELYQ